MKSGLNQRCWENWILNVLIVINLVLVTTTSFAFLSSSSSSFSSSPTASTFRRVPPSSTLLTPFKQSTGRNTSEVNCFAFNQAERISQIRAIQNCTTITQVQDLYLSFNFKPTSSYSINATSWSAFPHFGISVASLSKSTKILAKNEQTLGLSNFTLLPLLLKEVATVLVLAQRPSFQPSAESSPCSMYALSALLLSLEWISFKSKARPSSMTPLAQSLLVQMEQQFSMDGKLCLGPFRIWECFQACNHLGLIQKADAEHSNQTCPAKCIVATVCDRVTKGDVLATLRASQLAAGLDTVRYHLQNGTWNIATAAPFVKAFSRRLRKESVRDHATTQNLMQALIAAHRLLILMQNSTQQIDGTILHPQQHLSLLYSELKPMVQTITIDLLQRHEKDSSSVTLLQLRRLLPILISFQFHLDDNHHAENKEFDSIFEILCQKLCRELASQDTGADWCDLLDIVRNLAYAKPPLREKQPELFYQCGERLHNLVLQGSTIVPTTITTSEQPKLLNSILRAAILSHKENQTVLEPFLATCRVAFVDGKFLAACNGAELSNFGWFLSMAHARGSDYSEQLVALAQHILHPDTVETMTVQQAVGCLKSYVTLIYGNDENPESSSSQDIVISLMEELAGHMLSNQLSPAEASSALYAYARSNYLQDMGVFDHLTNIMAAQLSRATVRQVATSLWACGRMMRFEKGQDEESPKAKHPPYWCNAQTFFRHLAERQNELNAADTSQALWAIGHLGVAELTLVTPLLDRAVQLTTQLSALEIANIVWGVSKVLKGRFLTLAEQNQIAQLTRAILSLQPDPQAISSVLYALSVLEMADQATFSSLAQKMIKQIDKAEAQAISNALWAFQTSDLTPPRQLLDLWAAPKLGWIKVPTTQAMSPKQTR